MGTHNFEQGSIGMPINIKHDLTQSHVMLLTLGKIEAEFIDKEMDPYLKRESL